jgi:UDPglucose 6-dehydrogenase
VPIHEPGLDAVCPQRAAAGRLQFTTDVAAAVAHGTCSSSAWARRPMKTARPTCSTCWPRPRNIGRHMTDYKVVVDKSTVPVGTADKVRAAWPRCWPSAA